MHDANIIHGDLTTSNLMLRQVEPSPNTNNNNNNNNDQEAANANFSSRLVGGGDSNSN
jgi:hypothetical protein